MTHRINRRAVLLVLGASAAVATVAAVAAQAPDIAGVVTFAGGAKIPPGRLVVYLEGGSTANASANRPTAVRIRSEGGAKTIAFSLPAPAALDGGSELTVVARLERDDGWLLARGSAPYDAGAPLDVTLYEAMY